MKFAMSDDEIHVSYNTAKNKKEQVKILAELYPGLLLTVNGTGVRSVCLNVRVMMGGDTTASTLNLEVG